MAFTVVPWHLMGFRVAGDCGGTTIYTDRHFRKVFYKKAPPDKPASARQQIQRDRFRTAVNGWKSLTDDAKQQLELAVSRAHLCLTGQNLFTSCSMRSAELVYRTIERQTKTSLPPLVDLT